MEKNKKMTCTRMVYCYWMWIIWQMLIIKIWLNNVRISIVWLCFSSFNVNSNTKYYGKLRRLWPTNGIVEDSDFKPSEFERQNPSNLKSDVEIDSD